MLIPDLFVKWHVYPKGIVHIGAHMCEESEVYKNQAKCDNVLWIEADPNLAEKNPNVYQALISNKTGNIVDFIITDNDGQSSSFLELKEHLIEHPNVREKKRIKLETITFRDFVKKNNIDCSKYDFLAMDIQGAELYALLGMGDILNNFKYIYLEVNTKELYKGCGLLEDIIKFLSFYNFKMKDINMTSHGWGDAFFERTSIDNIKECNVHPNMSFLH